jgi:hypothetical protein
MRWAAAVAARLRGREASQAAAVCSEHSRAKDEPSRPTRGIAHALRSDAATPSLAPHEVTAHTDRVGDVHEFKSMDIN